MRRVYLDAQQWSYFDVAGPSPQPDGALGLLRAAVGRREVEVVGSLDLLQELIADAPSRPAASKRRAKLLFEFAGPRILLPLSERHAAEVAAGGRLSPDRRYLPGDVLMEAKRLARGEGALEVARLSAAEKSGFLEGELAAQADLERKLVELGGKPSVGWMRAWVVKSVDEWVNEIVLERGAARDDVGGMEADCFERFPSVWTFVAVRLARLAQTLGEGQRIKGSDLADAHHVACGPYVEIIVTDDRAFRSALDILRLPFRAMTSSEFFNGL
jgi:hypothetical protein